MITFDISELTGLMESLAAAPDAARDELLAATEESLMLLERNIKLKTPVGVGGGAGLRGSIISQPATISGETITGIVGTSLDYAIPVELGTKPHWPNVQALRDWVKYKLQVDPVEVNSVAYLVGRKISKVGTEGNFMFRDGEAESRPEIERIFARAAERIAGRQG